MRYVMIFLLFSLIGAALIFNFSTTKTVEELDDQGFDSNKTTEQLKQDDSSKEKVENLEKKAESTFKEIKYLEKETNIDEQVVDENINLKTATTITNTPKSKMKRRVVKFSPTEKSDLRFSAPTGDFYIQDHLKAVSVHKYNNSMGAILAQSQGYYFLESSEPTNSFPVVVKKRGRDTLALLTGLISIKTKSSDLAFDLKQRHNLSEVQVFTHLNLYIYKTAEVSNLISIYNSIKNEPGVDSAELEVLDKRVRKL